MLTLRRKPSPAVVREPDTVDLLLECHERIRRFTRVALWLAHAEDAPAAAVEETARSVLRYFTEALPRHAADEDESVMPRLLALPLPDGSRTAVRLMSHQHPALEEVLAGLAPAWGAIAADPGALPSYAEEMRRATDRLQGMWAIHLSLEENTVFPLMREHLSPRTLEDIRAEMRARRR